MVNSRFRSVFLDNYYLFEFLHKSYATAVAMATMTFQDGGYFGFKVI